MMLFKWEKYMYELLDKLECYGEKKACKTIEMPFSLLLINDS